MIIVSGERGTRMFPSLLSCAGEFNIVIDCNNAGVLAEFYSKLLGWEWTRPRANGGGLPLPLRQAWCSLFRKWKSILCKRYFFFDCTCVGIVYLVLDILQHIECLFF
ncbi:MAG: VOC family protein [Butyricimonas virosa]